MAWTWCWFADTMFCANKRYAMIIKKKRETKKLMYNFNIN